MVITLLFDGPQIQTQWPAYHATVLADDPGSSVLTLSCLGMAKLSHPQTVSDTSLTQGVVGMWKDPKKGSALIRIPDGKEAALLTITRHESECLTADGHANFQLAGAPEFAGLWSLFMSDALSIHRCCRCTTPLCLYLKCAVLGVKNPQAIYYNGSVVFIAGLWPAILLVIWTTDWWVVLFLVICVWCFCQFYHFAFYVIEHYVDEAFQFAGLTDLMRYWIRRRRD